MNRIYLQCPGHPEATVEGFLLDCSITLGQERRRPVMVVCPGGGYIYCSSAEAEPVALRYATAGYHTFILRYSTKYDAADFAPLQQLSWLIGLLREQAEQWQIDPQRIAVCGFSAGGHLAMASGVMGENRPNAMILGYPATCAPNLPGMDFMLRFLTGRDSVTDADAAKYELISKITKDSPPVFLMATAEDLLTPMGALSVARRYSELGMGYELHIFQYGPHGYSLADATSADGSSRKIDPAFAHWHGLSLQWLDKVFGAPEFVDKNTSRMAAYLKEMGITMAGF